MVRVAPLDPELLIRALGAAGVKFILIGALAARLQGFPRVTADADITPDPSMDNLRRLAIALAGLGARVYTEGVPEGLAFDCTAETLTRARIWNLTTSAGRLDLVFEPEGTDGYADLVRSAVHFRVFEVDMLVASLQDIIRCKEASDRPQDRQDVVILRAILKQKSGGNSAADRAM